MAAPPAVLDRMDAYWRACIYVAAGTIYLQDNPLLRRPPEPERIKKRLLGHWGARRARSGISGGHLLRDIPRQERGRRAVESAARGGNGRARLALEIYQDRICATVGALTAQLGGLDALVFTAGVGENAAGLRADVCANLAFLGLRLDPCLNDSVRPEGDIATGYSRVRVPVIHTREDLMIAREMRRILGDDPSFHH